MHGISQHVAFLDGGGTGRLGGSKMKCLVVPGLPALGRGTLAKVSSSFTSLVSDKTFVRKRILFLPKKCGKRLLSAMRSQRVSIFVIGKKCVLDAVLVAKLEDQFEEPEI